MAGASWAGSVPSSGSRPRGLVVVVVSVCLLGGGCAQLVATGTVTWLVLYCWV